jgi:hypothetical protein
MSNAILAAISGMADGYVRGKMLRRDMDRQDEEDAYRRERRERERTEAKRAEDLRVSLSQATAPRMAQSAEVYQPTVDDDGNAMPANPTAGTYKVEDKFSPTGARMGVYQDQASAQAAAEAANTPQQQAQRVGQAYMAAGDVDKAFDVQNAARQSELGEMQLAETKRQVADNTALREMGGLLMKGGWGAVPTIHERYQDGLTSRVEEDGKGGATVYMLDKDGKEVGKQTFADLPEFFATAGAQFDPKLWLADAKERRETARVQGNADRTFDLQKQQFALSGQREERMARAQEASHGLQRASLDLQRQRLTAETAPKAETPDSTFDSKTAAEIAKQVAVEEAKNAGGLDGSGQPLTADAIAARATSIVESMRREHTNRFVAATVQRELRVAQADPAAYALTYAKAAKVMPPEQLAALGFKPPAAAAPAAPTMAGAPAPAPRPRP